MADCHRKSPRIEFLSPFVFAARFRLEVGRVKPAQSRNHPQPAGTALKCSLNYSLTSVDLTEGCYLQGVQWTAFPALYSFQAGKDASHAVHRQLDVALDAEA
jgi:hypothetical protein